MKKYLKWALIAALLYVAWRWWSTSTISLRASQAPANGFQ
jgi:hypothetical protein